MKTHLIDAMRIDKKKGVGRKKDAREVWSGGQTSLNKFIKFLKLNVR
jgi:hypothetical protein